MIDEKLRQIFKLLKELDMDPEAAERIRKQLEQIGEDIKKLR